MQEVAGSIPASSIIKRAAKQPFYRRWWVIFIAASALKLFMGLNDFIGTAGEMSSDPNGKMPTVVHVAAGQKAANATSSFWSLNETTVVGDVSSLSTCCS